VMPEKELTTRIMFYLIEDEDGRKKMAATMNTEI